MIELFVAFGAGLISFLSPCVLPLIPGYISYISGSSLNELLEKKTINIFPIVLFTFGFSIVFISFGATATFLGSLILSNSFELRIIAGSIIIIFHEGEEGKREWKMTVLEKGRAVSIIPAAPDRLE